ncbi:Protein of unknown function, partial [Gryllus bimaculatus]
PSTDPQANRPSPASLPSSFVRRAQHRHASAYYVLPLCVERARGEPLLREALTQVEELCALCFVCCVLLCLQCALALGAWPPWTCAVCFVCCALCVLCALCAVRFVVLAREALALVEEVRRSGRLAAVDLCCVLCVLCVLSGVCL